MATKKLDLFQADKALSDRVADFMTKKVWGITLRSRIKKEITDLEKKVTNLENLRGSVFDTINEEGKSLIDEEKTRFTTESEEKQKALKKQIEDEADFEFTQEDKAFYKAYKVAENSEDIKTAIYNFLNNYGLDSRETTLEQSIIDAISGKKRSTARAIIRSSATKFNEDKRTRNDVLILMYGELAEAMLNAGTLKPTAIPEDVRNFYAPKNKKNSK